MHRAGFAKSGEKSHELRHHDQRPRRGFRHAQAVEHFAGPEPAEGADRLLRMAETTRSEEHTSELQSLMRISYAVFCLEKNNTQAQNSSARTAQFQETPAH